MLSYTSTKLIFGKKALTLGSCSDFSKAHLLHLLNVDNT